MFSLDFGISIDRNGDVCVERAEAPENPVDCPG